MDAHKIQLVQQSFEKVATLKLKAAEIFYAELFAVDPSLRAIVNGNPNVFHVPISGKPETGGHLHPSFGIFPCHRPRKRAIQ
jgi:hypothetical protein